MVPDPLGAINLSSLSISLEKNKWKMNSWHLHEQPNWLLVFTGGTAKEQRAPTCPWVSGSLPGGG